MSEPYSYLQNLPTETLVNIFSKLRGRDFYVMKHTCRRFQQIVDTFKMKVLPPVASSIEIFTGERYREAVNAQNNSLTLAIKCTNKKKKSELIYEIREADEEERMQPLPRYPGAERYSCLEEDGVAFYKPEPGITRVQVIAHTSSLNTVISILNGKVDQAYLRKFSIAHLNLNERFCKDLVEWMEITGVKFGAVEYLRCKINCEAKYFSPLLMASKEIAMDECKCTHGSPSLFQGEEIKKMIPKVDKLCLRPWITNHRWREAEREMDRARFARDLEDDNQEEAHQGEHEERPFRLPPVMNARNGQAWNQIEPPEFEDANQVRLMNLLRLPGQRFFDEPEFDQLDDENEQHFDDQLQPGAGFRGLAEDEFDEPIDAPQFGGGLAAINGVDLAQFELMNRRLMHIQGFDMGDEPEHDIDDDNENQPFMDFGGEELLSTTATEIYWGSHSRLTVEDTIIFLQEILDGTRPMEKFTLEHKNPAFATALVQFCEANMEKSCKNQYNNGKHYVNMKRGIFKLQSHRFK